MTDAAAVSGVMALRCHGCCLVCINPTCVGQLHAYVYVQYKEREDDGGVDEVGGDGYGGGVGGGGGRGR